MVNLLGIKCPIDCSTRWTGTYDICYWMMKNLALISSRIQDSLSQEKAYDIPDYIIEGFTRSASILFKLLLPFKVATNKLEADHMPAAYVTPTVMGAVEKMNEICSNINDKITGTITECIKKRMTLSKPGLMYQFLYSLTPLGRHDIRNWDGIEAKKNDSEIIPEDITFSFSKREDEIVSNLNSEENFPESQMQLIHQRIVEYRGTFVNVANSMKIAYHNAEMPVDDTVEEPITIPRITEINFMDTPDMQDEEEEEDESEDEYDDCDSEPDSEEVNSNSVASENEFIEKSNGPLQDNIAVLKEIATLQGYTPGEILTLVTQYGDWILEDPKEFIIHDEFLLKQHKCWLYFSQFPQMKLLSKFAMPLMGIAASEASCERAFWHHRRVLGDQGMKTKSELEKAKMFFAFK